MIASNKDALVAVNRAEGAAMRALKFFQPAEMRMAFIKLAIKSAADVIVAPHHGGEGSEMFFGQN